MTTQAYPYVATIANATGTGEIEVKCRVLVFEKRPDGVATCRRPDPYDTGEIEFRVSQNKLRTDLKPTHTFIHSSMGGTYSTECELLSVRGKVARIKYYDWNCDDILKIELPLADLTVIELDPILAAFEKEMKGRQYGADARLNALGWFRSGWNARG